MTTLLFKELKDYSYSEDFPNDVLVYFPYDNLIEGMYVRIREKLKEDLYTGILLNETVITDSIHEQYTRVLVLLVKDKNMLIGLIQ